MRCRVIVAFLFVLALAFAFGHAPAARSATSARDATLDFWYLTGDEKLIRGQLDRFEALNPGVKVTEQKLDWNYGLDKIILALTAGLQPDVCELGSTWTGRFLQADRLVDMTDEMAPIRDRYVMWDWVARDTRVYGAPWVVGTRALFYNKNLFRRAGLDPERPPETWDELLQASAKIDALGPEIFGFGMPVSEEESPWQIFMSLAWGRGARLLDENGRVAVGDKPLLEALGFYRDLSRHSLTVKGAELGRAFSTDERLGMMISGAWNFRLIDRENPQLDYGVALVPQPGLPNGINQHASFAGGEALVVFKGTKHPKEAAALIRFMIAQEQAMEIVLKQRNILPAIVDAADNPFFLQNPKQMIFFQQMRTAVSPPGHPRWTELTQQLSIAVERVLLENADPATALDAAWQAMIPIATGAEEGDKALMDDKTITMAIVAIVLVFALILLIYYRWFAPPPGGSILDRSRWTWLFLSPWFVLFLIFGLYPLLYSLILSFSEYNLLSGRFELVGLRNYLAVANDPDFYKAMVHTLFFAVGTIPFTMGLALLSAVMIDHPRMVGKVFFRAGLFLPSVTSVIVVASVFTYIYDSNGLLNQVLLMLHIDPPDPSWLLSTNPIADLPVLNHISLPLISLMGMAVWSSFGYYTLLFVAAMQGIPKELYEAARIDHAGEKEQFFHITVPMLRPIILFAVIINTIRSLQVFPEVFAMTQGGPLGRTTTVVYQVYETGFRKFQMGYASALGYVLLLVIILFTYLQMKFMRLEKDT